MTYYSGILPHTSDKLSGYDRVKVDLAQTSFFEGREFRSFKELNIVGAATYVIRAVVPTNIILSQLQLDLDNGWVRCGTYVGGTPGGTFAETLPVLMRNNMSVGGDKRYNPTAGVVLTAGGTHTGGVELDVLRLKASTSNANVSSVGTGIGDERGIAANTYYFRLLNLGPTEVVTGTVHMVWEERVTPPASPYA